MTTTATDRKDITVAILSGGAASRLGGRDKGLVCLLERPLIAWVLQALALEPAQPRLIVANRHVDQYACFAPTISDRCREVFAGPLGGIAAALDACETTWLYCVPVDCLSPHRAILDSLCAVSQGSSADVFVAHDGRRRQPLFALYRSALAQSAADALAAGAGVNHWQDSQTMLEVDLSGLPDDAWWNLNSPEDLAIAAERSERND